MFCKSAGLLFVSCLIMISSAYAQANNPYVAATDKYFANGDFYSASQYYEKFLKGGKTRSNDGFNPYASTASNKPKKVVVVSDTKDKVLYNLAESYRELHYHDKAAPRYQEVIASNKQAFPLARFHYAETLRAMGRFDEATAEFTTFKQEYQTADKYSEMASRELANLEFIKQQLEKKTSSFTVAKSKGLNAEGGTYAPTWMNEKTLVFTSTRPQSGDKSNHNRLYVANYSDTGAAVTLLPVPQPNDSEQGVASVAPDGNTIYLTRWDVSKNKKTSNIFISKKDKGNWSDPTPVAALNAAGSNSQQPCVMPGGKQIIFSSDRTGGSGGFDLWSAEIDATGNVGAPVNLGTTINTALDEQAPAYHAASNTLVFSSNGRKGMGGFDFYYTKAEGSSYAEPKNFGHPVNSAKDDIYFASRGPANNILEDVTFSSDRDAACCLELFSLKRPKTAKQISGVVVACLDSKPLYNIKVVIMDTIQNKIVSELRTDTAGRFSFTADQFQPLKASASDSGYFNNSIVFTGPEDQEESFYTAPELCLTAIPLTSEDAITLDNVYYDFNSAALQKRSFTSLNKLVTLLKENPALKIELNAHTDSKGDEDFNQRLSDKRAQSVVNYLVSKGIPKSRLEAKGLGESAPVAENTNPDGTDNPEGRQENRRTEFKVLEK